MTTFSERYGFLAADAAITIRNDAPPEVRWAVSTFAQECGLQPDRMRAIICRIMLVSPNTNNWSPENVRGEVETLLTEVPWHHVYDFAEGVYIAFQNAFRGEAATGFETKLNNLFRQRGIGFQMREGRIEFRGSSDLEDTIAHAVSVAEGLGLVTTPRALHDARRCLSERPEPNTRNAVYNAVGALEAAARHVSGNERATLGEIIAQHPQLFPGALKKAAEGLWGFASETARHVREGAEIQVREAAMVVGAASSLAAYLLEKDDSARGGSVT